MSTVSTAQTPDLLLSMLMGMLGSAPSTTETATGENPSNLFAGLLDSTAESMLDQSELSVVFPETATEVDPMADFDTAGGQLNALIAASLGAAPNPIRQQLSSKSAEVSAEVNGFSAELGTQRSNPSGGNASLLTNFNSPFDLQRQPNSDETSRFGVNSSPASQLALNEVALDAESGSVVLDQQQLLQSAAARNSTSKDISESASQVDSNSRFSPLNGGEASSLQFPEATTELGNGGGLNPEKVSEAENAGAAIAQNEPLGLNSEVEKDNQPTRSVKSRNTRGSEREEELSPFAGGASGAFGGFEDRPLVTAVSGGNQARQDGILGRGSAEEQFASAIVSRESRNQSSELITPEANQPIDLNSARADFEQSLDRVAENFPLESVAQQIVEVASPDSGWISIEIQPPNLGKLEIMVSKQGEEYAAQIIAHEPATKEALNLQQTELLEALNQHGLELKEVQIVSDSDSGNRWNLDSSRQDSQDGQSRGEFSGDRREDARREYPAQNQSNRTPKVMTSTAGKQQVNLLV